MYRKSNQWLGQWSSHTESLFNLLDQTFSNGKALILRGPHIRKIWDNQARLSLHIYKAFMRLESAATNLFRLGHWILALASFFFIHFFPWSRQAHIMYSTPLLTYIYHSSSILPPTTMPCLRRFSAIAVGRGSCLSPRLWTIRTSHPQNAWNHIMQHCRRRICQPRQRQLLFYHQYKVFHHPHHHLHLLHLYLWYCQPIWI